MSNIICYLYLLTFTTYLGCDIRIIYKKVQKCTATFYMIQERYLEDTCSGSAWGQSYYSIQALQTKKDHVRTWLVCETRIDETVRVRMSVCN